MCEILNKTGTNTSYKRNLFAWRGSVALLVILISSKFGLQCYLGIIDF